MKYTYLTQVSIWSVALFVGLVYFGLASVVYGGGTYHMNPGEAVDLKWDGQGVTDCRAANDYYTSAWGSNNINPPATAWDPESSIFGKFAFSAGVLTKPGAYTFRFNCLDDDSATRFFDDTYLRVYPVAPTGLSNNSCSGLSRTLSWSGINWGGFTGSRTYVVRVTKPTTEGCDGTAPGGTWTQLNSTTCQVTTTGTSVTFDATPGTSYSWRVASRAGSLISANTSNGVHSGDDFTGGTSFSCNATPQVELNFDN